MDVDICIILYIYKLGATLLSYLSVCMYVCMYINLCTSMYIYVYLCTSMYIYVYPSTSMYIYVYLYMFFYVYLCVSMCIYVYLCISLYRCKSTSQTPCLTVFLHVVTKEVLNEVHALLRS